MPKGYLCFILHAHLPFVRHPEYPEYLQEDWLYEAITETYLPLLQVYEELWRDGIDFRISMTMSPPLISMLNDELLRDRYAARMRRLLELTAREQDRHRHDPGLRALAEHYHGLWSWRLRQFEELYQRDLVRAFGRFQDLGRLEILTCGATHGFLPLMQHQPEAVRAQIELAARHYEDNFGRRPLGIWLPECAYYPGLEPFLQEAGLAWFIGESHAIAHAVPRPIFGVHAPIVTPGGVAVFGRDLESSRQVWSSEIGYPGDPAYRDFYRDVGFDAPEDYIRPWIQPTGLRKMVGLKYHRVTGKTDHKELYDPHLARQRAAEHASNFTFNRRLQIEHLHGLYGRPPIVVSPYDAELFGHWWFEGPDFLNFALRQISCDHPEIALTTPSEYLRANPTQQVAQPPQSTWGANGDATVWLNPHNDWIYPHLHAMAERMVELAARYPDPSDLERRALNQAARELLLAQSSDWAFIIHGQTDVYYAEQRTREHIVRFNRLYEQLTGFGLQEELLRAIELRDNLFPDIDYRLYTPR
jgi:1,4-alpha-glucan branching enzyme